MVTQCQIKWYIWTPHVYDFILLSNSNHVSATVFSSISYHRAKISPPTPTHTTGRSCSKLNHLHLASERRFPTKVKLLGYFVHRDPQTYAESQTHIQKHHNVPPVAKVRRGLTIHFLCLLSNHLP